jgi:hypothetical protein
MKFHSFLPPMDAQLAAHRQKRTYWALKTYWGLSYCPFTICTGAFPQQLDAAKALGDYKTTLQ